VSEWEQFEHQLHKSNSMYVGFYSLTISRQMRSYAFQMAKEALAYLTGQYCPITTTR